MTENKNRFWVLRNPNIGQTKVETDYDHVGKINVGDAPLCALCHEPIALRIWKPPFRVSLRLWGSEFGDIAFGGSEILISKRFKILFVERGLTGLDIFGPAEVVRVIPKKMEKNKPEYFVARVKYSRVIFDDIVSEAEWETPWTCPECRTSENIERYKRVVIKEETWNGEDIFIARGLPGEMIASERFKDFCEINHFKNVNLIEASKYSIDFYPEDKALGGEV